MTENKNASFISDQTRRSNTFGAFGPQILAIHAGLNVDAPFWKPEVAFFNCAQTNFTHRANWAVRRQ